MKEFLELYKTLTELALYYTTFFGALHFAVSCFLLTIVVSPLYFMGVFFKELFENMRGRG